MEIAVEDIFRDFKGRREGLLNALTTDVEDLYSQCDPERENLCLYGYPDETWELKWPDEGFPPEYPEPTLGINFARDGMRVEDWVSLVAAHSDAWLLASALYCGIVIGFGKNERERLFQMINELPTILEVLQEILSQETEDDDDESDKEEESAEDDDESGEVEEHEEEEDDQKEGAACVKVSRSFNFKIIKFEK